MKKVIIIGSPGSGKSTFARKLSEKTKLPLFHLDNIYHKSDGSHIEKGEFDKIITKIMDGDSWILDGNYQRTLELRIAKCDTVFLLDISTDLCLDGARARVGKKRDDLPWVEDKLNEEFAQRIYDFSFEKLPQIYEILDKNQDKNIIIFKNRKEIDDFINNYKE